MTKRIQEAYVPHQATAQAEVEDTVDLQALGQQLGIPEDKLWILEELGIGLVMQGIQIGIDNSGFGGNTYGELAEAYNAGVIKGQSES
jgi:hypothetical protein